MTTPVSSQNLYGSEANAAEQSRMELQAKLNGLGGLNGRKLSQEAKEAKLREACQGFESIFIQKMWQEMRNAIPKTGLLTGREERMWQDMYDQELAKSMTKAGGIGLADMMYEQLSRNLVSASRGAADAVQGASFAPGAAPLVPQQGEDLIDPPSLRAEAIYEQPGKADPVYDAPAESRTAPVAPLTSQGMAQAPVPAAAPLTAQNAAQPASSPAGGRVTAGIYTPAPNTAHSTVPSGHRAADLNQASGMALAHNAMREAGDKLSSGAVRPARHARPAVKPRQAAAQPQEPAPAPVQSAASQPGFLPGSPEAIRAALDNARAGAGASAAPQQLNLRNIVAEAQQRNMQAQQDPAGQPVQQVQAGPVQNPAQPAQAVAANEEAPGIVRVRKTTNIPQRSNSGRGVKRQSQAIRTLNVDNVGVNSRQGQGLSAYHAQQEMAAQMNAGASQAMPAALAPRGGYTQSAPQDGGSAIPPLTASDARI